MDAETLAELFHRCNEKLAVSFEHEAELVPWSRVLEPGRTRMVAVAAAVLDALPTHLNPAKIADEAIRLFVEARDQRGCSESEARSDAVTRIETGAEVELPMLTSRGQVTTRYCNHCHGVEVGETASCPHCRTPWSSDTPGITPESRQKVAADHRCPFGRHHPDDYSFTCACGASWVLTRVLKTVQVWQTADTVPVCAPEGG